MTRVLVIGAWFPYPPRWGWATRVYHLARQLARRHDVTLLTYATEADRQNVPRLRSEFGVEVVHREALWRGGRRRAQLASLRSRVPFEPHATYSRELQEA